MTVGTKLKHKNRRKNQKCKDWWNVKSLSKQERHLVAFKCVYGTRFTSISLKNIAFRVHNSLCWSADGLWMVFTPFIRNDSSIVDALLTCWSNWSFNSTDDSTVVLPFCFSRLPFLGCSCSTVPSSAKRIFQRQKGENCTNFKWRPLWDFRTLHTHTKHIDRFGFFSVGEVAFVAGIVGRK